MAFIRKRVGKYGTTYRAEVVVKGIRAAKTFDRKSEAVRWGEDKEESLRTGVPMPGEINTNDMLFEDAMSKYLSTVSKKKAPKTEKADNWNATPLLKFFSGKTLRDITKADVIRFRDLRAKTVGASSIRKGMTLISEIYNTARLEWGLEDIVNPEADVKRPPPPSGRDRVLTEMEITRLLDFCCVSKQEMLYPYVFLMLQTASRPSEIAGLQWREIIFEQRMIVIPKERVKGKENRRVPLTKSAVKILKYLQGKAKKDAFNVFIPDHIDPYESTGSVSQYFRRSFNTAKKNAGIDNFVMYGLRHSAATHLLINGVDVGIVSKIMGHKKIDQTMKYTHLADQYKVEAIEALSWMDG